jgi:hypothetical protein
MRVSPRRVLLDPFDLAATGLSAALPEQVLLLPVQRDGMLLARSQALRTVRSPDGSIPAHTGPNTLWGSLRGAIRHGDPGRRARGYAVRPGLGT